MNVGSNENRNRVLRRFISKGNPIEQISNDELIAINWWLNSRPMKCLNWQTPIEVFLEIYMIIVNLFLAICQTQKLKDDLNWSSFLCSIFD